MTSGEQEINQIRKEILRIQQQHIDLLTSEVKLLRGECDIYLKELTKALNKGVSK